MDHAQKIQTHVNQCPADKDIKLSSQYIMQMISLNTCHAKISNFKLSISRTV
jgi:hypothetical protein